MSRQIFYEYSASAIPHDPDENSPEYTEPLLYTTGYYKAVAKEGNTLSSVTSANFGVSPTDYIAYYAFNNNTNDQVSGGSGTNTNATATTGKDGDVNGAYYFDQNAYITLNDSSRFDFGTNDFTISVYVKNAGNTSAYPSIISGKNWSGGGVGLRHGNTGNQKVQFFWNGVGDPWLTSSSDFNDNEWLHIVLLRSGNDFKIYVNKTLQATGSNTGTINFNFGGDCKVGWGEWDGSNGHWNGAIDELKIYDRALSESEIDTL
jgi:hypothetical protein